MIDNKFTLKKILGQGGSSRVYLATDNNDQQYAVKILRKDKKYSYERGSWMIQKEYWIMTKLQEHPNILNWFYFNPDGNMKSSGKKENVMYNLLELADNGPVSNFIRVTGPIEENLVRFMFLQLGDGVKYMHSKLLAHLDLKLENILLDKYFNIKLADLGVSHQLTKDSKEWAHRRGTMHYMAPEVAGLQKDEKYEALKADIYSLGVWLYILLIGEFPDLKVISQIFLATNDTEMDDNDTKKSDVDQTLVKKWNKLSENSRNLIVQMLEKEPFARPSIDEIFDHAWFSEDFTEETQCNLYNEMSYRKTFIADFLRKKPKAS